MKRICLDAGRDDRFYLDLGAQALSNELSRLSIAHTLEIFDGTHDISADRHAATVQQLVSALATSAR